MRSTTNLERTPHQNGSGTSCPRRQHPRSVHRSRPCRQGVKASFALSALLSCNKNPAVPPCQAAPFVYFVGFCEAHRLEPAPGCPRSIFSALPAEQLANAGEAWGGKESLKRASVGEPIREASGEPSWVRLTHNHNHNLPAFNSIALHGAHATSRYLVDAFALRPRFPSFCQPLRSPIQNLKSKIENFEAGSESLL